MAALVRLIVATIFASSLQVNVAHGSTEGTKSVLLLYSHQTNAPIIADWDRGIRRALAAGFPEGIRIETEHLDLGREEDDEYQDLLVDLLRKKHADKRFDLVVPVYVHSFRFVVKHRDLFHNAPVVFCSVPEAVVRESNGLKQTTGVLFTLDFVETVNLARELFPTARNLVVISGAHKEEQMLRKWAEVSLAKCEDELKIDHISGVPLPRLCNDLASLDAESIVLVLSHDGDTEGNTNVTVDSVKDISQHSGAPVFGVYDTPLGFGILGGKLASAETQGAMAGELAVRVLNGEEPDQIPWIGLDSNRYMFDARQLLRWKIAEDQLPLGSQVQFKELTFWDQYGGYLVALAGTIAIQSLVIAALVVNRSRRLRAEHSLRASRTQARDLAGKLISAQEDERKRLARELHDDLSQRLAASAITAGKLERESEPISGAREGLTQLKQDLIDISEDVHRISRQIHPAILDDLGMADALRSECDRLTDRNGIPVTFRCGELPDDLPNNLTLCLYRIAQEALWNAIKHAQSERIEVTLSADVESIHLEILDRGIGFDTRAVNGKAGLGLASMNERARLNGGKLKIISAPQQGTVVAADLPLPEQMQ